MITIHKMIETPIGQEHVLYFGKYFLDNNERRVCHLNGLDVLLAPNLRGPEFDDQARLAELCDRLYWVQNIQYLDCTISNGRLIFRAGITSPVDADPTSGQLFKPSRPSFAVWGRYVQEGTPEVHFEPTIEKSRFVGKGWVYMSELNKEYPRQRGDLGHGFSDRY